MGEYIGEVKWCNSVQMEIATDKTLHNGDGLCFLNADEELVGIRADVVRPNRDAARHISTVVCNRPHGATRGSKIFRNYDIEWQRQVEASKGNRKIDIDLVLTDTEDGFEVRGDVPKKENLLPLTSNLSTPKIVATNPEKALENIRKKLSQWGDTIYNPINIDINLSQPYLIPASVLGELKRQLVMEMTKAQTEDHQNNRSCRDGLFTVSIQRLLPDAIPTHLMTCHHCIRYANGMCPKVTGKPTGPLYIRNGENIFPLEFDCKNCLMYVCKPE